MFIWPSRFDYQPPIGKPVHALKVPSDQCPDVRSFHVMGDRMGRFINVVAPEGPSYPPSAYVTGVLEGEDSALANMTCTAMCPSGV